VVHVAHKNSPGRLQIEGLFLVVFNIGDGYFQPFVQVCHFTNTFAKGVEIIFYRAEYFFIGQKAGVVPVPVDFPAIATSTTGMP